MLKYLLHYSILKAHSLSLSLGFAAAEGGELDWESTETEKHQAKSINRFPLSANTSSARARAKEEETHKHDAEWSQLRTIQQRHMNQRGGPPPNHPPLNDDQIQHIPQW